MKVAELEGAMLDAWVARAEGLKVDFRTSRHRPTEYRPPNDEDRPVHAYVTEDEWSAYPNGFPQVYAPSTAWAQGGPIIERESIGIWKEGDEWDADYGSPVMAIEVRSPNGSGPTPLVAAMRAYVARKFGPEIPDTPPA